MQRHCIGVSRRIAQATVSKELAQGSYVAARAGVEPTTLQLRVIDLTNAPLRPTTFHQVVMNTRKYDDDDLNKVSVPVHHLKLQFFVNH